MFRYHLPVCVYVCVFFVYILHLSLHVVAMTPVPALLSSNLWALLLPSEASLGS